MADPCPSTKTPVARASVHARDLIPRSSSITRTSRKPYSRARSASRRDRWGQRTDVCVPVVSEIGGGADAGWVRGIVVGLDQKSRSSSALGWCRDPPASRTTGSPWRRYGRLRTSRVHVARGARTSKGGARISKVVLGVNGPAGTNRASDNVSVVHAEA
jgi:hypothetical protein